MEARNFRYLFENTDDGIVLSGGIWDMRDNQCTNFAYVCGMRNKKEVDNEGHGAMFRFERNNEPCHIFILASFSIYYIKTLLRMLHRHQLRTVLLPYVSLQHRLALLQWYQGERKLEPGLAEFMEHPYTYLKNTGVENVYLLQGNGEVWRGEEHQFASGHHFELLDKGKLQTINEMEGHYVPVVKAGYIIENDWLFYFGHYEPDVSLYEQPGSIINSTIVMFQCPLHTGSDETDSVMAEKVFSRQKNCVPYFDIEEKNCFYKCIYEEDYTVYRKHKKQYREEGCFGTLTVGNVNMGRYLQEIFGRFYGVRKQIRAITISSCGNREYWNRQCLTMMLGEDLQYWVCGLDRTTSPFVISDVAVASPLNRIVTISEEYGYCFSGYLVPFEEDNVVL
jgi:hypothetical protein